MRNFLGCLTVLACVVPTIATTTTLPADAETQCSPSKLRASAREITVNQGDTNTVRVTGYAKPGIPPTPAPDVVVHVRSGVPYSLNFGDISAPGKTTLTLANSLSANIVIDPTPKPSPTPSASSPANTSPPAVGGPDDKLTAAMKDERLASFTQSTPAPAKSPAAGDDENAPVSDYSIKGEYPGNTTFLVSQGTSCVAIGIRVRPSISNRFFTSAGVGTSFVPKYAVNVVQGLPAAGSTAPSSRVVRTDESGHQVAVPLLFNYRLTDHARGNLYGSVGFFANSGGDGFVYGLSFGRDQFLWTVGLHSNTVTDLGPGLHNNDIVPNGFQATSVTRRVTALYFGLSLPTSFVTQLLGGSSSSTGAGSGSSGSTSSSSSQSAQGH